MSDTNCLSCFSFALSVDLLLLSRSLSLSFLLSSSLALALFGFRVLYLSSLPSLSLPDVYCRSSTGSKAQDTSSPQSRNTNRAPVVRSTSGLTQADLDKREQVLLRREASLRQQESSIEERARDLGVRPKNWPSKCFPILYHSIKEEIPAMHQPLLQTFYVAVLFSWLCLFWNWLVVIIVALSVSDYNTTNAIWASLFVVAGVPGSWTFWYRAIYRGTSKRGTRYWLSFFIFFTAHVIFCVLMGIGIASGAGLFLMFDMISKKFKVGIFMSLVAMILWGLNLLLCLYLFKRAVKTWKDGKHPDEMKKQLAKQVVEAQLEGGRI